MITSKNNENNIKLSFNERQLGDSKKLNQFQPLKCE